MEKIRLITLFSGYDSQALSMERLKRNYPDKFDYELVAWCEIDKAACMAHDAIFPQWKDRNLGDISKVKAEDMPDCDCMTWSFPCTDISGAGKQMGLSKDSGTRSSLCWEAIRCFKAKRPKFLLMENVAALAQRRFIKDFHALQYELEQIGYTNFCAILDSSKYGVPQHRERLFMISILACDKPYHFPEPFKLEKRIKDILEPYGTVDESFYFSPEQLLRIVANTDKTENSKVHNYDITDKIIKLGSYNPNGFASGILVSTEGISPTVMNNHGTVTGVVEPCILTPQRTEEAKELRRKGIETFGHRELVPREDGVSNTITTVLKDNLLQEPVAVRMIGRNPDNPSDRSKGCPTKQTLEFGTGISNCITTVQKDSMVAEPMVSDDPRKVFGEFRYSDVCSTLLGSDYKSPKLVREPIGQSFAYLPDKTVLKDEDGKGYLWQDGSLWRVRKLTPIEVFRLQDVSDEDAKKIIAVCSKTACYQLAGNSITISPLYHIFRRLWIDIEDCNIQKSLFDF